ncbi:MAG: Gfo/Idh/MocA family oxidoreductase [Chloroflexi bacterium]|nr:Gfo/Idh/MocA family oxidoreductase [Chloroflexota bacterium]
MRVAVIGVGSMGKNHARVYSEMEGAHLVSVADVNQELAASVGSTYGAKAYSDYREMLRKEDLDAVSVVVPTRQHRDVAIAAIERGLGLMIEKPLASDVQAGEEIVTLARKKNAKVMVGHIERCNPAIIELKRQLDLGRLGPIYHIHASRVGPFAARIRDVGVAMDLATHDLDIMLHLTGSQVSRAYAETREGIRTEHEDLFTAILRFANGVVGTLDVNWVSPVKQRWLSVTGKAGMFKVDYQAQTLDFFPIHNGNVTATHSLPGEGVEKESLPVVPCEPLKKELEAFTDVVNNGRKPLTTGEDALEVIRLAQSLVEASQRGEVVSFAEGGRA